MTPDEERLAKRRIASRKWYAKKHGLPWKDPEPTAPSKEAPVELPKEEGK